MTTICRDHPPDAPRAGPAPPADAAQPDAALPRVDRSAQVPGSAGLHRHRNPDADQEHARRRARLPGALARERRPLLRAAAVAAAVQADADGVGLRPLLPDHQVLPRRRPARRPSAGIHPDRLRNLVPERTRDPRDLREHDPPRVQGGAGRGPAVAVPDHDLDRSHAPLRLGQAGPAREPGIHRHDRRHARRGLQGLRRRRHGAGQPRGRPARAGRGRDVAQRDRRLHAVRRYLRRQGPGLHQGQRSGQGPRRPAIAHRQEPA